MGRRGPVDVEDDSSSWCCEGTARYIMLFIMHEKTLTCDIKIIKYRDLRIEVWYKILLSDNENYG